jgi:hypothetical protein
MSRGWACTTARLALALAVGLAAPGRARAEGPCDGVGALALAAAVRPLAEVEALLAAGSAAEPPEQCLRGARSPLEIAAERGHPDIVALLLARGAAVRRAPMWAVGQHDRVESSSCSSTRSRRRSASGSSTRRSPTPARTGASSRPAGCSRAAPIRTAPSRPRTGRRSRSRRAPGTPSWCASCWRWARTPARLRRSSLRPGPAIRRPCERCSRRAPIPTAPTRRGTPSRWRRPPARSRATPTTTRWPPSCSGRESIRTSTTAACFRGAGRRSAATRPSPTAWRRPAAAVAARRLASWTASPASGEPWATRRCCSSGAGTRPRADARRALTRSRDDASSCTALRA